MNISRFRSAAAVAAVMLSDAALAQSANPILGAVTWIKDILMGPVATTVAVIAVAMVGFMMLTGRMNWKHGAVVILGLFILFGAPHIVASIQAAAG
jgi:type IV secretion system protein VirB2